jgi:FkbM family methyltransferase
MKTIIVFILILLIWVYISRSRFSSSSDHILKTFNILDDSGKKINNLEIEIHEQRDALQYIEPSDIVLQLGARFGSVSIAVAYKQKNSGNLVVVEPDTSIIPALTKNKNLNNSNFIIVNKYISNESKKMIYDGYATKLTKENSAGDSLQITYDQFKKEYPFKFNVLIADCEGCLCDFIDALGDDINNYNKILFEADQKDVCSYENLVLKLKNLGFKVVKNDDNFRYVMLK